MASQTSTDRIGRREQSFAKLEERLDNLRVAVDQIDDRSKETEGFAREIDKRLVLIVDKVERIEKGRDDLHARRWDL